MEFIGIRPKDGPPRIVAASAADLLNLEKISPGRQLSVIAVVPRSSKQNRWWHKLVAVVADGLGVHPATLKAELKFKSNLIKQIIPTQFGIMVELQSVSFQAMRDEQDFTEFRRISVEVLFRDYLPGVKRRDVYAEVEDLTGEPCPW